MFAGGVVAYNVWDQKRKAAYSRTIPNHTEPPPSIRIPQQGNGLYGYFGNWFYGGAKTSSHILEM